MKEQLDKLVGAVQKIGEAAGEAVATAVEEAGSKVSDLRGMGTDVTRIVGDEVNQLIPAIQRAGYEVTEIDIDLVIPPKLVFHCRLKSDISDDERVALLQSVEGSRIASTAVKLLLQVAELRKKLNVGNLQPTEILLEAGLTAGVRVRYKPAAA